MLNGRARLIDNGKAHLLHLAADLNVFAIGPERFVIATDCEERVAPKHCIGASNEARVQNRLITLVLTHEMRAKGVCRCILKCFDQFTANPTNRLGHRLHDLQQRIKPKLVGHTVRVQ